MIHFPCTGLNYAFHDHGAGVLGITMMKKIKIGEAITPRSREGYVQYHSGDHNGYLNNADAIMASP